METTFICILDISKEARIRYISDSVEDILGYRPQDVVNKTSWDYFHPEELPFAKAVYGRGVRLDKAAVLNYCRVRHNDGSWIGCECVFSVVYDVLISCVSIYRRGNKSEKRATAAPVIRRIFSSSPRDPRYHMLSYLSNKFQRPAAEISHEPRAALFLNRFTRTAPIMFATNGVEEILGLSPGQLVTKSFYYCISGPCLGDAVRCIESAKANDSIAYLRFKFRNPLQVDVADEDMPMDDPSSSSDDDVEGGVDLDGNDDVVMRSASSASPTMSPDTDAELSSGTVSNRAHHSGSGTSTETGVGSTDQIFDRPEVPRYSDSSASSAPVVNASDSDGSQNTRNIRTTRRSPERNGEHVPGQDIARDHVVRQQQQNQNPEMEIEAVVSCTSDGLVVIIRKAKAIIPDSATQTRDEAIRQSHGIFASPWADEPMGPPQPVPAGAPGAPAYTDAAHGTATAAPAAQQQHTIYNAIRDVAVFAWSLTGINGSITDYSNGTPVGEALPPGGVPVWNPQATVPDEANEAYNGFADNSHRRVRAGPDAWMRRDDSGIAGLTESDSTRDNNNTSSSGNISSGDAAGSASPEKRHHSAPESTGSASDEEIVWRRAPVMPPWRPSAATRARRGRGSVSAAYTSAANSQRRRRVTRQSAAENGGNGAAGDAGAGAGAGAGGAVRGDWSHPYR